MGEPQTRMYSTPSDGLPVITGEPTSYADSHLLGQLRDRSRWRAPRTSQHVGKNLVGERAAADLGRGEPVALEQHLARLVDVADLRVAAGDVQVVVRPPLGQQRVEAHRIDLLVGLHRGTAVAELDRRGAAVQLHVGRAEAGPVVVVVAAELERGLLGA